MKRSILVAILLASFGCSPATQQPGAGEQSKGTPPASGPSAMSPPSKPPALVGEWQRTQKCPELVKVLTKAGMKSSVLSVLAEDGWIPGVSRPSQIKNPSRPCEHAVARKHSHFFTADGYFGSRDAKGEQVDDGQYQLIGKNSVVIGGVTFHYNITAGGDTIAFKPVIPDCAPRCFKAIWSVSVAYPGYKWHRIS
jgi:hypothetical protein